MAAVPAVVTPETDQEHAATVAIRHRLAAVPVVDADGRLLGQLLPWLLARLGRDRISGGSGHVVTADSAEGDTGARPAELLLMALAGCTAMDVISILRKKRQPVERYEVSVAGAQRSGHPAVFERIEVEHTVHGFIEPEGLRRAIELSATRYCAVGATLSSGVTQIRHRYRLLADGALLEAEVCTTGPYRPLETVELPTALAG